MSKPQQPNQTQPPNGEPSSQPNENEKIAFLGKYRLGKTLGKGSYSVVKKATDITTKKRYAIKIIDLEKLENSANKKRVFREIGLLKRIDHPHIVRLYDVFRISWKKNPDKYFLCLVLEHVEGITLFEYIVSHKRLDEDQARSIFRQILSALRYSHHHLVVHRDLKPENILLDQNMNVKLIDFGFGNNLGPGTLFSSWLGSFFYAAPEIFLRKPYPGPEVDVWSLGVMLYTMLSGSYPWLKRTAEAIVNAEYVAPSYFSPEVIHLIRKIFQVNPNQRTTLDQIAVHPWTMKGCTSADPLPPPITRHPTTIKTDPQYISSSIPSIKKSTSFTHNENNNNSTSNLPHETISNSNPSTEGIKGTGKVRGTGEGEGEVVSISGAKGLVGQTLSAPTISVTKPNSPSETTSTEKSTTTNSSTNHSLSKDISEGSSSYFGSTNLSFSIDSSSTFSLPATNQSNDNIPPVPTTDISVEVIDDISFQVLESILKIWPGLEVEKIVEGIHSDPLWRITYRMLQNYENSKIQHQSNDDQEMISSVPKVMYQSPNSPLLPGQKTIEGEGVRIRQRVPRRPDHVTTNLYHPQLSGSKRSSSSSSKSKQKETKNKQNNSENSEDSKNPWWSFRIKREDRIKVFKGPDSLGMTTSRSPDTVIDVVKKALNELKFLFKSKRKYYLKCKTDSIGTIKFDLEIYVLSSSTTRTVSSPSVRTKATLSPSLPTLSTTISKTFGNRVKQVYRIAIVKRAGDAWDFKDSVFGLMRILRKKLSTNETTVFGLEFTPSSLEPVPSILIT